MESGSGCRDCRRVYGLPDIEAKSREVEVQDAGKLQCLPLAELFKEFRVGLNSTLVHRWVATGADGYLRSVGSFCLSSAYLSVGLNFSGRRRWGRTLGPHVLR